MNQGTSRTCISLFHKVYFISSKTLGENKSDSDLKDRLALVAQAVGRRPAEREVSGSIPDASRPSVWRPRLRPPGAGMGSRAALRRSLPVNGYSWPVGGRMNNKKVKAPHFFVTSSVLKTQDVKGVSIFFFFAKTEIQDVTKTTSCKKVDFAQTSRNMTH